MRTLHSVVALLLTFGLSGCSIIGGTAGILHDTEIHVAVNEAFWTDPRIVDMLRKKPAVFSSRHGAFGIVPWLSGPEISVGSHSVEYRNGALARQIRLGRIKPVPETALDPVYTIVDASMFTREDLELIIQVAAEKCRAAGIKEPVTIGQVIGTSQYASKIRKGRPLKFELVPAWGEQTYHFSAAEKAR